MATKKPAVVPEQPTRRPRKSAQKPGATTTSRSAALPAGFVVPSAKQLADMSKMASMLTPEQVIELYKANAKMALDVINAAIDSTAKLRKLQFEGEEEARAIQRKAVKSAAEARTAQGLMEAGQGVAQEALQKSMHYWSEMFDLITEIQKRLFSLMETQMEGAPGMAMMPDVSRMKNVVTAMQGLVSSGGSTFGSMQKMLGDMTRMAQSAIPGMKR